MGISSQSCDLEVVPGTGLWREHSHQRSQHPPQIRPFVCFHESSSLNTCQPSTASEMVPPSPRQVTAPEGGIESMFVSHTELLGEADAVEDPGAIPRGDRVGGEIGQKD